MGYFFNCWCRELSVVIYVLVVGCLVVMLFFVNVCWNMVLILFGNIDSGIDCGGGFKLCCWLFDV